MLIAEAQLEDAHHQLQDLENIHLQSKLDQSKASEEAAVLVAQVEQEKDELEEQVRQVEKQLRQAAEAVEAMRRVVALKMIYHLFDLDGGGDVGEEELLELGQARRRLGQKQGEWTMENTRQLMEKMGTDANGMKMFLVELMSLCTRIATDLYDGR